MADGASAHEWVRQAAAAWRGVESLRELTRQQRAVFFQKVAGTLIALEEADGDIALQIGQRAIIQATFARYFDGALLDGPPWRLDPTEPAPTSADWFTEQTRAF